MFLSLSKFLSTVNPPREDIVHYIRVHTDIQVVIMNKYITEYLTNLLQGCQQDNTEELIERNSHYKHQ